MKIPVYILGFLIRFGPLHGYKLKQHIADHVSDFVKIKLPAIYYHLEKMKENGYVTAETGQEGKRPERSVYSITEAGREEFIRQLRLALQARFEIDFTIDATLYFFDLFKAEEIITALKDHEQHLSGVIETIGIHKKEIMQHIPENMRTVAGTLFNHHLVHYEAELQWVKETMHTLSKQKHP